MCERKFAYRARWKCFVQCVLCSNVTERKGYVKKMLQILPDVKMILNIKIECFRNILFPQHFMLEVQFCVLVNVLVVNKTYWCQVFQSVIQSKLNMQASNVNFSCEFQGSSLFFGKKSKITPTSNPSTFLFPQEIRGHFKTVFR